MNYGQTNGIPQGSVLMDFIAEMVLGYIDERLSECLDKNMNYHIIRYRDDYRIFTNNKKEGNTVIGELSKILSEMGMRLNGEKTYHSDDIVNSSIKKDKLHQIIHNYQQQNDLKNQLLVIKNLADNYPNSGSLNKALNNFDKDLQNILTMKDKNLLCTTELVSILTSIALKNPKIYQSLYQF
ncbi:RNA-directed DNA polymerase [bacterium endosymbiont of Bathymodiolus sp. 5 South]|uniref:RNA-directed DNA polymerase n=1 Tax=bacterium endosymbiont of Bathymodiolus sp. 5 South TaxID=1181670 RepID=UPI0015D5DD4D|nr:RNA-directed DNA polymerase [bacterium endosymbiont of Bathymodiolus sp. 5 South]